MSTIVAIGGGEIRKGHTEAIDKHIVSLAGKKKPHLLFIPTASYDADGYAEIIENAYAKYGCTFDVLFLKKRAYTKNQMATDVEKADIIYVGGGNTLMMMHRWKFLGFDALLKKAYKKGTILCGISAGSICWFESGHSDSRSFYNPDSWKYIRVRGLGLIPAIHCPHYNGATNGKKRRKDFHDFILKHRGTGLCIDDSAAVEFTDGKYKVIQAKQSANAYIVTCTKGVVEERKLEVSTQYKLSPLCILAEIGSRTKN